MEDLKQLKEELRIVRQELTFIAGMLKAALPGAGKNLWMNESEVMSVMNVSKKTLQNRRKSGEIEWRCAGKGRNIQYSRKSVENYLSQSTMRVAS